MLPIRSILVATDLSEHSDPLVRAGAAIAEVVGAQLHLLHAFDLQPYVEERPSEGFPGRIAEAERALDQQILRAVPRSASIASRQVVIHTVHKAILERAQVVSADLIVLGPHRARGLAQRFLGSTADRVVRTSPVPVLIIGDGLTLPLRRVVAPIDLSEPARAALDHALWWTAALGTTAPEPRRAELRILHVVPRVYEDRELLPSAERVGDEVRREIEEALARFPGEPKTEVTQEIRWGESPADEILRYAEEVRADLLVLGTHGRGMIERALIGSVASTVARRASCPVLLVPPSLWRERK